MKFQNFDLLMREYEEALDQKIPPRIWPVVRLDGRSFSHLTEKLNFEKPFDIRFRDAMIATTKHVMQCGFQAIYAYVESDEISILFSKHDNTFKRKIRKWLSNLAGEASAAFTHHLQHPGVFDARICPFPDIETILDYFSWRQGDSARNSLNAYCYWTLRHDGKSERQATKILERMPVEEKYVLLRSLGVNHKEIPSWQRYGVAIAWKDVSKEGYNPITKETVTTKRRILEAVIDLPRQQVYQDFVQQFICEKK